MRIPHAPPPPLLALFRDFRQPFLTYEEGGEQRLAKTPKTAVKSVSSPDQIVRVDTSTTHLVQLAVEMYFPSRLPPPYCTETPLDESLAALHPDSNCD